MPKRNKDCVKTLILTLCMINLVSNLFLKPFVQYDLVFLWFIGVWFAIVLWFITVLCKQKQSRGQATAVIKQQMKLKQILNCLHQGEFLTLQDWSSLSRSLPFRKLPISLILILSNNELWIRWKLFYYNIKTLYQYVL